MGIRCLLFFLSASTAALSAPPESASREEILKWLRTEYAKPPAEWPAPTLDEGIPRIELGTPAVPEYPDAIKPTKEKQLLGLSLFFDPRLSGSQQISCARCHDPEKGWADGRSIANGVFMANLTRNTPGLLGIGHAGSMFWDGRVTTLEDQARTVILNPKEMAGNPVEIVKRLTEEKEFYGKKFEAAFGDSEITFDRVVSALASFQRGLRVGRSDFDKFLGGKPAALKDSALSGLHIFRTSGRCMNCHNGPMLTDGQFHNAGLTYYGRRFQDLGRHAVTQKPEDIGRFRTPSLRNVGNTGPWMHNGLFPRLRGVLNLYNSGMPRPKPKAGQEGDPLFPVTSPLLHPLKLSTTDLEDLEAFLLALNEPSSRILTPPFPPLRSQGEAPAPAPVPEADPQESPDDSP